MWLATTHRNIVWWCPAAVPLEWLNGAIALSRAAYDSLVTPCDEAWNK